jgi:hypothetical protein
MTKRIPLVSSSTAGPLGVVHLPRLWAKVMLYALDALPENYWCLTRGFDANLLEAFGVSAPDCHAYVESTLPNYQTFETWACHRAVSLTAAITTTNEVILNRDKPEERAAEDRAALGLSDASVRRGFLLNDLDDWQSLHTSVVAGSDGETTAIVPAVSSNVAGPLGVRHLPRLWLIAILRIGGLIPRGYDIDRMDRMTLDHLGIDANRSEAYLRAALPDYVQYEQWVRENAQHADAAGIDAHNAALQEYHEDVLRVDLLDWQLLHEGYLAEQSARNPSSASRSRPAMVGRK